MSDNSTRRALLETVHFVPVFYFVAAIIAFIALLLPFSGFMPFVVEDSFPRWAQAALLLLALLILFNFASLIYVLLTVPNSPCISHDGRYGYCNRGFVAELTAEEYFDAIATNMASVRFSVRAGLAMMAMIYLAAALYLQRSTEDA